jgi:hypothetical protein
MGSAFYEVSLLTTTVSGGMYCGVLFVFLSHNLAFLFACMHDEVALGSVLLLLSPSVMI